MRRARRVMRCDRRHAGHASARLTDRQPCRILAIARRRMQRWLSPAAGDAPLSTRYVLLNILMQADDLRDGGVRPDRRARLCGQINLAQAAFFGIGAYAVGLGTVDLPRQLLDLPRRRPAWPPLASGALLGATTLRLGGHYLAMVTISFQQIFTWCWSTGSASRTARTACRGIQRPSLFAVARQAYLAFCVAVLALVGYLVWRLPDTRLGRAMRAVRDNELAAGRRRHHAIRTKVIAFTICAVLGGSAAVCSPAGSPISARTSSPSRS